MKIILSDLHKLPHRAPESKTTEGFFMYNDLKKFLTQQSTNSSWITEQINFWLLL